MSINSHLRCSLRGKNFIKDFEKLSSTSPTQNSWVKNPDSYTGNIYSYWDSVGKVWTIGWGHTGGVFKGQVITRQQADRLFEKDIVEKAERFVKKYINVPLNQNQFDALCSFTYNAGCGNLLDSSIRKYINKKEWSKAYEVWLNSNTKGGNSHLRMRRKKEANLFSEGLDVADLEDLEVVEVGEVDEILPEEVVKEQFVEYIHSSGVKTIDELLIDPKFIVEDNRISKQELLSVTYLGKTNHERLFDNLDRFQKSIFSNSITPLTFIEEVEYNPKIDYPITDGAILIIPNSKVSIGYKFESDIVVGEKFFSNYFPAILRQISQDPGYKIENSSTKEVYLKNNHAVLTVFGWSKLLHSQGENLGYIDLTGHSISVNTTNTTEGNSSFTIELSPLEGKYEDGKWLMENNIVLSDDQNITLSKVNRLQDGVRRRQNYYFKEVLQENDLVFISFEKLIIEGDKKKIPNNWYDMIGMVDTVRTSVSANGVSIIITGRSLMKALQNDNSYFNPYTLGVVPFKNGRFLDGRFYDLDAITCRSIRDSIQFIFHRISSINYVPSEIFQGFDNLTVVSSSNITSLENQIEVVGTTELQKNVFKEDKKELRGIWQIIKVFVDDSVRGYRIVDDSISNPNGSVFDLIQKICQYPFVEMFSDSYGDKHYIIIRKPPFDEESILDALHSTEVPDELRKYSTKTISDVQKSIEEKDIVIEEMSTIELEEAEINRFPKMLILGDEDVLEEDLQYSNTSYAWYQLSDMGNFAGQSVNLGVYPGVYIDEIAQIFGNNRLNITSNYSNQDFWSDNKSTDRLDLYAKHASELLSWVIETNIYLPFTRQGSIVIAGGDRRFRVGNWFYYKPTNEIFYIKSVTNSLNIGGVIDRVTVLQVERGMVKDFLYGKEDKGDPTTIYSYFNIMNIKEFKDQYYDIVSKGTVLEKFDQKSILKVNSKVLDFFMNRRQTNNVK